ncbi:MAG: AAA family ATPase [Selenomonas sp.]|nr:AAA family ATPase [Selenomonas sp.]
MRFWVIKMTISRIKLEDFLVFKNMEVISSLGINVFIGRNGVGKTQLMKAVYAHIVNMNDMEVPFSEYFKRGGNSRLLQMSKVKPLVHIEFVKADRENKAVFIPVKDMLTHAKGLLSMEEKYREFPFDRTLTDIIRLANQWTLKEPPQLALSILPKLEEIMDGTVEIENDEFFIRKHDGTLVNFAVEAEGLKKIGLFWQLLMNENITENSILVWDEPEANLNPEYLPVVVECLLELARHNVQIFVSTHNYLFAKYFDVRRKQADNVMYHSLYRENEDVHCETKEYFADLHHNAIMDAYNKLLDEVYGLQVGD